MRVKAVTRKKGIMNVEELNAYKTCYGKPLDYKDYGLYVGLPALVMAGFTMALWYYWWISLIFAAVGAIYGFKILMPQMVRRQYALESLRERNRFINNMTQILSDASKPIPKGLSMARARAKGELQNDLTVLEARLQGADNIQIKDAFRDIREKYSNDVIFAQYFEQLETAIREGRTNIDTMKQIKSYHNDMKKMQEKFLREKSGYLSDMKQMVFIICIFILSITFSFSFKMYYNGFAHTIIGWVSGSIWLALMMYWFHTFFQRYFDDDILNLGVAK